VDRALTAALWISVPFNAIGALAFAAPGLLGSRGFVPEAPDLHRAFAALTIALFGAGYLWCAASGRRDPVFLAVAAAGKLGFFAIVAACAAAGSLPARAVSSALGDLVLGGIFAAWLLAHRGRV
jgi:hypothetical protein